MRRQPVAAALRRRNWRRDGAAGGAQALKLFGDEPPHVLGLQLANDDRPTCELRQQPLVDQFLRYHLPRCDCPGGALRTPRDLHAALVPLLTILREQQVIARPPPPAGPIADELRSYDTHMRDARGLTDRTRHGCLRIVASWSIFMRCTLWSEPGCSKDLCLLMSRRMSRVFVAAAMQPLPLAAV